jgi:hypothetical protein
MLDRIGAKRPVVLGSALAAVAFGLWAQRVNQSGLRAADSVHNLDRRGHGSCSAGRVASQSAYRCRSAAAWELRGRDNESGLVPGFGTSFSAAELRHFETAPRPRSLVVLLRAHGTPCVRRRSTVRARGVGARW